MTKNLPFSPALRHILALIALLLGCGCFLVGKKILHFWLIKLLQNKVY